MPDPSESLPPKAARILAAAGELLLARGSKGVTIADVARKGHIGKGTVYLYWKTKEDLLLDLLCRDFLALADEVISAVAANHELIRPSRLCPNLLHVAAAHPYVLAVRSNDAELLGVLTDDARSATLLDALGPDAMVRRILPIWRTYDLARTDWSVADQALAVDSLFSGFMMVAGGCSARQVEDPDRVFAASFTALLGPERAAPEQVEAAAAEAVRALGEQSAVVRGLLSQPAASTD
ncbi:TetR family transcriptional regulator [Streptomyces olivaceoviridis]|uniref:TetR family transcriptional regulator n=1 Tax=Streptomyces olivaceoviridis TaxID=1921 RepID=UPI0033A77DAA